MLEYNSNLMHPTIIIYVFNSIIMENGSLEKKKRVWKQKAYR